MAWESSNFQGYMTTGHLIISLKLLGFVRLWHETDFSKSLQTFTFQTTLKMIKISWQSLILCQKFSINFFCFGIMLNGKFLLTIKWLVPGIASGSYNTCQKKPVKFGIKVWVLRDASTEFCLQFKMYDEKVLEKGIAYRVVFGLVQP